VCSSDLEAERAMSSLNGKEMDGRALNINEARPKESGGGYRGRSGGGGSPQNNRW
jgi:cold-inducible RNA-binding protein